jgi:crossover junction endodeoxyribonuclease RuvC
MARLIGLDPGLRATGWGVIEAEGNHLRYVACGVIRAAEDQPLASRLSALYEGLVAVLEQQRPDQAAVEETFVNRNASATLKLGMARGIALLAPARFGIPVGEYSANRVKKSVVGVGHAEKAQVAMMVRRLLPGIGPAGADAMDALAVAVCHAHYSESAVRWQKRPARAATG